MRGSFVVWLMVLSVGMLVLPGCGGSGSKRAKESVTPRVRTLPPPTYAEISARYNARVKRLERLSARADIVVTRPGAKGEIESDQIEGNMQFRLPRLMNLRIDKVGNTLFVMGSSASEYWWFDLSDEPRGWFGTHAKASREVVSRFGVPVQPADLAELLAVVPMDPAALARVTWTPDGAAARVAIPTARGPRRIEVDVVTFEPRKIELLDDYGDVVLTASLEKYAVVPVRGDALSKPRLPTSYKIEIPSQRTSISLRLTNAENPGDRQKDINFDLGVLVDRYAVERLENLDEVATAAPAPSRAPASNPTPTRGDVPSKASTQPPAKGSSNTGVPPAKIVTPSKPNPPAKPNAGTGTQGTRGNPPSPQSAPKEPASGPAN